MSAKTDAARRALVALLFAIGVAGVILIGCYLLAPVTPASSPMPACPTEDSNTTAAGEDCFWHAPLGGRSFAVIDGTVLYVFGTTTRNGM